MALSKTLVPAINAVSVAAAGSQDSGWLTLADAYEAGFDLKITNGATGPTIAQTISVYLSPDQAKQYLMAAYTGGTANNDVTQVAGVTIPRWAKYVKFIATGNTGQAVTADVSLTKITSL